MSETTNQEMNVQYHVDTGALFWLALKTTLLTVVTLGIYRFWARTRVRRFIWSAIRPGGDEFEYTGTGLEKFLGFLLAVVVLAVYLGVLQVLLTFVGFNLIGIFTEPARDEAAMLMQVGAMYLTLLALAPILFFAQYRGRRYMLSRTRWRGVRLGMDKAALGFVWRALLYSLLVIVSLGILTPLATFRLEKYMADRTWYGDAKLEQGGSWTMLYASMKHLFFALIGFVAVIALMAAAGSSNNEGLVVLGVVLIFVLYFYMFFGAIHYQVDSFNRLTNTKTLEDKVTFRSEAKTWSVIGLTLLGMLIVMGIAIGAGIVFAILIAILGAIFGGAMSGFAMGGAPNLAMMGPVVVIFIGLYLVFLGVIVAANLAFVAAPVLGHYVNSFTIFGSEHLDTVKQRVGDDMADADGFADALDIGGAF